MGKESGSLTRRDFCVWAGTAIASLTVGHGAYYAQNKIAYAVRKAQVPSLVSASEGPKSSEPAIKPQYPFEAIAVLSSGINDGEVCGFSQNDQQWMSTTGMLRIDTAILAVSKGLSDTVIFLGGHGRGVLKDSDALVMERVFRTRAEKLKVDVSHVRIILEEESNNTSENMEDLKTVINKYNFGRILTITNDYHMENTIMLGLRYGDDVYPYISEEELTKTYPGYGDFIKYLKDNGYYKGTAAKERIRSAAIVADPDLKMLESIWNTVGSFIRKKTAPAPDCFPQFFNP